MNKLLVTGATGFVGSALAARFLARSMDVVALSRRDPDGTRSRAVITEAARGCGLDVGAAIERRLQVIDVDFSDLARPEHLQQIKHVTHAWHCAAEMSYAPSKLASSFEAN